MAEVTTSFGADISELKADIKEAAREHEKYVKTVERIDRAYGRSVAREFRQVLDRRMEATRHHNAFVRTMGRGAATLKKNWGEIWSSVTAVSAAAVAGFAVAERSVTRYAERYEYAARRIDQARGRMARGRDKFDRNMFLAYDASNPGSLLSGAFELGAKAQDAGATFLRAMRPGGLRNASVKPDNDAMDRAERIDLAGRWNRNADTLMKMDRVRLLSGQGRIGAAATLNQELERKAALGRIHQIEMSPQQRAEAILRLEEAFDRMATRFEGYDESVARESTLRSRAVRHNDGTAAGAYWSQHATIQADAEAARREARVADGTPETRAAALARITAEVNGRVEALQRERDMQVQIARIERERVSHIGKRGFDARRAMTATDAQMARARARGTITDPGALATELARIDATEAATVAGIGREQAAANQRGADMLEGLRIERLRRRGRTDGADRAQIRMRYAAMEREMIDAFGPDGGGRLDALRDEMRQALADVALGRSAAGGQGVAPALLGGFEGVRDRVSSRKIERLLGEVAENTKGTIGFTAG